MKAKRWLAACGAVLLALAPAAAFDKEHGRGQGKHEQREHREYRYSDRDREALRGWYSGRRGNLPPGLAKRDELPPGLERQLVVRGTLPPGLRKKIHPCPPDLVRLLPPPPAYCRHVIIGGHVVLMNSRTYMVLDIFHFAL
jgi:hypothetical protein